MDWLDALTAAHSNFHPTSPKQEMFLSWQTWDLLRVMSYGIIGFCEDFIRRHPGYYVVPVRVSGSAVETVFAQLKHAAGGRLSATTIHLLEHPSLVFLTQRSLHTVHSSGKSYRDSALHSSDMPLQKKKKK